MPRWWSRVRERLARVIAPTPVPRPFSVQINGQPVELQPVELPPDVAQAIADFFRLVEQLRRSAPELRKLVERHPDVAEDDELMARIQVAWEATIRVVKPVNPFEFGFMDELYHRVTNTPGCQDGTA